MGIPWQLCHSEFDICYQQNNSVFKFNDNISQIYSLLKLGTFASFLNNPSTQIIVLSVGTLVNRSAFNYSVNNSRFGPIMSLANSKES